MRQWIIAALAVTLAGCSNPGAGKSLRFSVSIPSAVRAEPLTGRIFVFISRDSTPEPRSAGGGPLYLLPPPVFGVDVSALPPAQVAVIDGTTPGYPPRTLSEIPAGDYYVQGLAHVYTEFHRSDGHTIWAHAGQWNEQRFTRSAGDIASAVQRVHLDPAQPYNITLSLTRVLPAPPGPAETEWVKRVTIQSDILTKFWGHPVYMGAVVLLPKGYDAHSSARYPVVYDFTQDVPLGFTTDSTPERAEFRAALAGYNRETGYAIYQEWNGPHFPRMIGVTLKLPTPYGGSSYVVNSANNGPYGDAIVNELIPYLESHFRMIGKEYARILSGGSTGGWESLALQLYHPDVFGGTWTAYPDPIDFRDYSLVDVYTDTNAFVVTSKINTSNFWGYSPVSEWWHPERPFMRSNDGQMLLTNRLESQSEDVLGSHGRSGGQLEEWEAVHGPAGADGYPVPLWDKQTGHIDPTVVAYMRGHGFDLRAYAEQNWATLGPKLVGKIHIDAGDMDNFYLNRGVVDFQQFLDTSRAPHVVGEFHYGRPAKGHWWHHATWGVILKEMAAAIKAHAPRGENVSAWNY